MDRDAVPALEASSVSGDHTAGKTCELQKNFCGGSLLRSGAAFNLKPSHSYFAMATCIRSYALTLSLASSDIIHHDGLAWPSLGCVCPCGPHRSCSALLAWHCGTAPGGTRVLPRVQTRVTLSIAPGRS